MTHGTGAATRIEKRLNSKLSANGTVETASLETALAMAAEDRVYQGAERKLIEHFADTYGTPEQRKLVRDEALTMPVLTAPSCTSSTRGAPTRSRASTSRQRTTCRQNRRKNALRH